MKCILLVDDITENRYLLESILKASGYKTVSAANGAEALAIALKKAPDMVISDALMPVMDGFSLCREWKQNKKLQKIPFIFYTATYTDPKDEEFALSLGADRFITKPQEMKVLLGIMKEIFSARMTAEERPVLVPVPEEKVFLKEYNEVLVRKLEYKLTQLKAAEKVLKDKNAALEKDIEERKRTEEKNLQLVSIIESSDDAIIGKTLEGSITSWNAGAEKMYGFSKKEVIDQPISLIIPSGLHDEMMQILQKIRTGQHVDHLETIRQKKDGTQINVSISISPIFNAEKKLIGASTIARDITEHKRAEETLKETEDRFEKFMANLPAVVFMKDREDRLLFANPTVKDLFGWHDAVGKTSMELLPPELARQMIADDKKVIEKGPEIIHEKVIDTNGVEHFFETHKFPFYKKNGEVLLGGISIDETDRRRAEEEIKMNKTRLESLIKISQRQTESRQELLDFALNEAITLTGSKIGYIYFYDDKKLEFTLNTWSKEVMKECSIVEPQTIYQLEKTGLWGEAVRQKKPIIVNDFQAPHALKKGYPEGHASLFKYLTIPVISDGRIVAVVGVANKEIDYNDTDVRQLTLLMDNVWQISERKRAEEELRKLSLAVEQSPASIVITDTRGAIEYINPKFVQLTGYSLEEAIGLNPRILKSGEKPMEEYKQLWERITSGSEWRGEFHNKKKNGELYWESAVISPIKDAQGMITHFLAVKEDITQRKQAEEALHASEENFRAIFENNSSALAIIEPNTTISMVNDAYCQMGGYTREEVIGMSWTQQIPPDDLERLKEYNRRRLINPQDAPDKYEFKFFHKDGTIRYALMSVAMIQSSRKIVTSFTDITERKKMEKTLKETSDYLDNLFKYANAPIIVWDQEFRITRFNQAFERITGRGEKNVVGQHIELLFPEATKEQSLEHIRKTVTGEKWEIVEIPIKHVDGTIRTLLWNSANIYGMDGKTLISTIAQGQDITERKQAEEGLRANEDQIRLLLNSTAEAIYGIDLDGNCTFCNNACVQILGYKHHDELLGKNMHWQIHNKHADGTPFPIEECRIFKAFQKGENSHVEDEVLWRADGTAFPAEYWSYPQRRDGKILGSVVTFFDITQRKQAEAEREKLINELQFALDNVKTLQGLIPICANCKKIRDDSGYWQQVEGYIQKHSDATFSHGICPDCAVKLYPDYAKSFQKGNKN